MKHAISLQRGISIIGLPLLFVGFLAIVANSPFFDANPDILSIAITSDLILTVPFIYYLLIRRTSIRKITVVPVVVLCTIACSIILPIEYQGFLNLIKTWALPVVELFVLAYLIFKVRKAIKIYRNHHSKKNDFYDVLNEVCVEIFPKALARAVATEIAVFYYGFIYWRKRILNENEFSYHKESGSFSLLTAFIFIILIEAIALHLLIAQWSTTAAWILTALSLYTGLQIFGFLKSMLKRPIVIADGQLHLRYGIMNETTININDIDSIEISTKDLVPDPETRKLSLLGELESHNVIIHLKQPHTLFGLYGIKHQYRHLAIHVDQKNKFSDYINRC